MSASRRFVAALALTLAGCVQAESAPTLDSASEPVPALPTTAPPTPAATTTPPPTRPQWLGGRPLATTPDGAVEQVRTPSELLNRSFASEDSLPAPETAHFESSVSPFEGEPLERSTYHDQCPVKARDLSYLQVTFLGFDGAAHTGELVVHRDYGTEIVEVFRRLYQARFPIEEMRLVTPGDLEAEPTGDSNNTTAYVCRSVTGGSRWSDHALGTAIDINPFHNPYQRGALVIPELADAYLQREPALPGMVTDGDVVVSAFADIGWSWGGNWRTLKDYQHFSLSGS